MVKRKTSSRNRGVAPPLDQKRLSQGLEEARQAHDRREEEAEELERRVRRWEKQKLPERLIKAWFDWCVAEKVNPVGRLEYLLRPLEDRLADLFYESSGWVDDQT